MSYLPVIVGFGGVNASGRTSFHHGYRRQVIDQLSDEVSHQTLLGLATMMGLARAENGQFFDVQNQPLSSRDVVALFRDYILNNTLIRRINHEAFDINNVPHQVAATLAPEEDGSHSFVIRQRHMPEQIPSSWVTEDIGSGYLKVKTADPLDVLLYDYRTAPVQSGGQLPTGFAPGELYQSRHHPRALQMSIFGASDCLGSMGIDWQRIRDRVRPDQIAVYAGNSIGQLDDYGFGGMLKAPFMGKRTTSKQMPLGYGQMPADFINAYVLGSVGATGTVLGACSSFLYNLQLGVQDIRSGARKVVMVGGSDTPITPEIIEGFRAMGALAEDKNLRDLDNIAELTEAHYRRSCRPFSTNCGFTVGEAAQFVMLMSDDLAVEMGAQVFGSVPDVFVNADGNKKSISAPGIGNYLTLGKTAGLVRAMLGEDSLRNRSFIHAHGTSTPQNRTTESHVLNEIAKAFDIPQWPVAAIKCFLGHSQGTAAGDQLVNALGVWAHGIIPGIGTIDHVADDVNASNLRIQPEHTQVGLTDIDSILLNSKGFGGNNASSAVLAPHVTMAMLAKRHGKDAITAMRKGQEAAQEKASEYDTAATHGTASPVYHFGQDVLAGEDLSISADEIRLPGYAQSVNLKLDNPFGDMS
ncbi:beta-ketoacyl synthase [Pokkaliibacter sp. CJK22405]|uniref:beta-ketoacyl synthase n=1 Tax=Pokkaliibacter sp. CJK22405 TaxID=3384615 RepID=UPI0039853E5B